MRLNIKAAIILVVISIVLAGGVAFAHKVRVGQMTLTALDAGRAAYERKDWNEAARQLKVYLLKNPDDVEILRLYGRAHLIVQPNSLDNIRSAIGAFERVIRNIPADAEATIKLARVHYKVGNYSEAVYVLRRRLAAEPDDSVASLWLARTFIAQHEDANARELLLALSQKQPPMMKSFGLLAALELADAKSDANDRARSWLDAAVTTNATLAEALVQRARFRRVAQKDSGSRQDASAAQALNSTDPGVQLLLADEWIALDELILADQAIEKIRDVAPETLEEYDLDRDEFLLRRYLVEGQLTLKNGDAQRGETVLQNAMTQLTGPTRANFVPMAVNLALEAKNVSEARSIISQYSESISREEGIASPLTKKLILAEAAVAEAEGHSYAVINRLANFVISEPGIAEAWRLLGRAYGQTDQPRLARHAFEQQIRLAPNDEDSLFELARLWRRDNPTRAIGYVQRLCKLAPSRAEARALEIAMKIDVAEHSNADSTTLTKLASDIDAASTVSAEADVQLACQKARLLVLQDDCLGAQHVLERALEGDNGLPAAVKLIGVLQQAGELESAIGVCNDAAQRWPTVAATRILHSELIAQLGSVYEARTELERAINELQDEERLTAQVALAQFDLDHDRREQAISDLKQLAQENPDNVKLRLGLLRLPEVQRDHSERIRWIEEIHSIEGEQGLAWRYEQALASLHQSDWQTHRREIESNLEYCIAVDHQWPAPVVTLGEAFERLGELQRAKQAYRKGFEQELAGTTIASRFLNLLIQQREFNEAAAVLTRFPAELPTLESPRIDVAVGLGRYDEAIQRLERKLEKSPDDVGARILLAKLVYEERKDISEAMWLLEQQPTNSMALISARVTLLHAGHRDDEAFELLTSLESQSEDGAKLTLCELRANLLESLGRTDEAEGIYRTAFANDPSSALSNDYAEFLLRQGRPGDAIEVLESSLVESQDDFALRRILGRALAVVQNDTTRAQGLALLDELLSQEPADIELLLAKAKALAAISHSSGDALSLVESEKALRRVLSIQPWNGDALGELAWLIGVEGDRTGEALEMTNRGLSLQPNDPRLLHCRATILTRLKRTEAARTDLLRCVQQENISGMTLFHALLQLAELETAERHCSAAKSLLDEAMALAGVDHVSRDGSCLQIENLLSECEERDHGAGDGTTFGLNSAAMVGAAHSVAP